MELNLLVEEESYIASPTYVAALGEGHYAIDERDYSVNIRPRISFQDHDNDLLFVEIKNQSWKDPTGNEEFDKDTIPLSLCFSLNKDEALYLYKFLEIFVSK